MIKKELKNEYCKVPYELSIITVKKYAVCQTEIIILYTYFLFIRM